MARYPSTASIHPYGRPYGRTGKGGSARWALHASLALAYAAVAGVAVVWPRWVEADVGRTALALQHDRETELIDELEIARAVTGRLRIWGRESRRVFLAAELARYPALAREAARQAGARVVDVRVTNRMSARWRALQVRPEGWEESDDAAGIEPRVVYVRLAGRFGSLYRAVAALSQQQQLFVPDRWAIAPRPTGEVQAEVWGTVFAVSETGPSPQAEVQTAAAGTGTGT